MSKVYSFRLDDNNPREAQAREVINAWVGEGYPLRHIVTEALINFNKNDNQTNDHERNLERIIELLEKLVKGDFKASAKDTNALSTSFVESLEKVARTGLKMAD